jgi:hypothetical protein
VSSIEPDCSGGEVERGEEISGGLIVARSYGAVLFEFTEEILDQVACLVESLIELTGRHHPRPRALLLMFRNVTSHIVSATPLDRVKFLN